MVREIKPLNFLRVAIVPVSHSIPCSLLLVEFENKLTLKKSEGVELYWRHGNDHVVFGDWKIVNHYWRAHGQLESDFSLAVAVEKGIIYHFVLQVISEYHELSCGFVFFGVGRSLVSKLTIVIVVTEAVNNGAPILRMTHSDSEGQVCLNRGKYEI